MENAINGLQEYLKQVGQYEIFTPEEEKEAFEKYRAGAFAVKEEIINRFNTRRKYGINDCY